MLSHQLFSFRVEGLETIFVGWGGGYFKLWWRGQPGGFFIIGFTVT